MSNKQEPVAWTDENFTTLYLSKDIAEIEGANVELYAAPPKREPLRDEQIEQGRKQVFNTGNPFCPCDKTMRKAVRWAERAHKIGGQS